MAEWQPVELQAPAGLVNVFGGTFDGWSHLLTIYGTGRLATNAALLVLDLTDRDVAAGLREVSVGHGKVTDIRLPRDAASTDLLYGLRPEEMAEALLRAVEMSPKTSDAYFYNYDLHTLTAVIDALEGDATPARIAAGIGVLQHDTDKVGRLTDAERDSLAELREEMGVRAQQFDRLTPVRHALLLLSDGTLDGHQQSPVERFSEGSSITVVATSGGEREDVVGRLVFHGLLLWLRSQGRMPIEQVLVVAGADRLDTGSLERLAELSVLRGMRLVYLFQNMHMHLIDRFASATLIMRLGDSGEAAAAAAYIGPGRSLTMSSLGSEGGGQPDGRADSRSASESRTRSGLASPNVAVSSRSAQEPLASYSNRIATSLEASRAETRQKAASGGDLQRLPEFVVDATAIRSLPSTVLILTEGTASARRTVVADCSPAIALTSE